MRACPLHVKMEALAGTEEVTTCVTVVQDMKAIAARQVGTKMILIAFGICLHGTCVYGVESYECPCPVGYNGSHFDMGEG